MERSEGGHRLAGKVVFLTTGGGHGEWRQDARMEITIVFALHVLREGVDIVVEYHLPSIQVRSFERKIARRSKSKTDVPERGEHRPEP